MPLFVTVAPGVEVSNNTVIDAALLNLLAQPSVSVIGSVDGGSLALGASSVVANSIAANAVNTVAIADGAVTAAKLGALAVTTAKIDALAVTTAKIDALAVTTAKLDVNAVTTAKILDSNVTLAKIAPITQGNIVGTGIGGTANSLTISSGLAYDATKLYWSPGIVQTHANTAAIYTIAATRPTSSATNNIAALNTSILTTRSNSRILITVNINYEVNADGGVFILYRDAVEIGSPASPGNNQPYGIAVGIYDPDWTSTQENVSFTYLDTVVAVATYAYKICFHSGAAVTFNLNRTWSNSNTIEHELGTSRMILQEFPA